MIRYYFYILIGILASSSSFASECKSQCVGRDYHERRLASGICHLECPEPKCRTIHVEKNAPQCMKNEELALHFDTEFKIEESPSEDTSTIYYHIAGVLKDSLEPIYYYCENGSKSCSLLQSKINNKLREQGYLRFRITKKISKHAYDYYFIDYQFTSEPIDGTIFSFSAPGYGSTVHCPDLSNCPELKIECKGMSIPVKDSSGNWRCKRIEAH